MRIRHGLWFAIVACACACGSGPSDPHDAVAVAGSDAPGRPAVSDDINPRLLRRFRPVDAPPLAAASANVIALGRRLFHDPALSLHGDLSCNSCHVLATYGVDHLKTSPGTDHQLGSRNTPSVFNAGDHIAQFWDGRVATIEQQAAVPILNPVEMAMPSAKAVTARLEANHYAEAFARAFPDDVQPITLEHVGEALGAFERGLVTTSRWDAYLAGNGDALSAQQKHGLRVFIEVGCVGCHTGPQVGGTMFQRAGAVVPWPDQTDLGRYAITHLEADRMVFKVPSLKNIRETAPYFHDGSVSSLDEAIRIMGRHQLGLELGDDEVTAIAAWMGSMTGTVDARYADGS